MRPAGWSSAPPASGEIFGMPSIVASRGPRSLRAAARHEPAVIDRHPADEGRTFSDILEQLRRRLASPYMADDRISVQQIAWLLGYSEVGVFNHAYKRVGRNST